LESERIEREHWEGEYHRYAQEVHRFNKEGDKNHETIKELHDLVEHLKKVTTEPTDRGASPTQTLDTIQRELESKRAELVALKLTLDSVDTDLATEPINHRGNRDTLLTTQNTLTTANDNLATALLNTVVVNSQLLTVREELDFAETGDLSEMACSTFAGKQFEDAVQHVRTFRLWLSTKKLPARAAALHGLMVDAELITAEISFCIFVKRLGHIMV